MTDFFAKNCLFITGPTASGKTSVAISFAQKIDAEILSLDSMAIYREMNIGTAKPSAGQLQMVPHHLLDIIPPTEDFSVAQYVKAARTAAEDILNRGKRPLFVGGTPLYIKALLRGIFEGPPANAEIRQTLQMEAKIAAENGDFLYLHRLLQEVDRQTAARLHPNDEKRLVRALEVYRLTGKPICEFQTQFQILPSEKSRATVWTLDWPREELHQRIQHRVDLMFSAGLVKEVEALLEKYQTLSRTASQAVGYREVIAFLKAQNTEIPIPLNHVVEEVKAHSRQLARRQCTWFRSLPECKHVSLAEFQKEMKLEVE
ncbi:MAG: tRNA (adenosine(37)-N6)-dimethylallyltransferase MiaA [Planctomycetia bacterium]|nr:tRNA (adenosine(37)-N6)-dimethylallyltransferase MiaA [Planctomycetia bacterium]